MTVEKIDINQLVKDPTRTIWLSANAGCGKTYQLTERAVGLLLQGIEPHKLLCLTYTRIAASEMRRRIFARLAELAKQAATSQQGNLARDILISCIEAGNNFKVMTIHSFCQELLKRFPIEAGVAEHFEVADEVVTTLLHRKTFYKLILKRQQNPKLDGALQQLVRLSKDITDLRQTITKALEHPPPSDPTTHEEKALCLVVDQFKQLFEEEKRQAAVLTYGDLIAKTVQLLEQQNGLSWVNYKLDSSIDHILVDEAQDTSPDQWRVILALCGDFFSGVGTTEQPRSLFVVGDEKQSIYSFQGADLKAFHRVKKYLKTEAGERWLEYELTTNRRSPKELLGLVDKVFASKLMREAITQAPEMTHKAHRISEPCIVELKEFVSQPNSIEQEEAIATRVENLITTGIAKPEEVMILLRKRGSSSYGNKIPIMERIISALKRRGIKVLSSDNRPLIQHLNVMDLMAVAKFCLYPSDDYNLACLLKSPLLGAPLTEAELFELASKREKKPLWDMLKTDPKYKPQTQLLAKFKGVASYLAPFEFYMQVLNIQGEKRLLSYISEAERETVNVFLHKTLAYEKIAEGAISLNGFLTWLEETEQQPPKAETAAEKGSVRIMTVHSAKGLEAPFVIIADAHKGKNRAKDKIFFNHQSQTFNYIPLGEEDSSQEEVVTENALSQAEEEQRLLYVALTRSRNYLMLCGEKPKYPPKGSFPSWYSSVEKAMDKNSIIQSGKLAPTKPEIAPSAAPTPPSWLNPPVSTKTTPQQSPATPEKVQSPLDESVRAIDKGIFIHKLLEVLPTVKGFTPQIAQRLARSYLMDATQAEKCYATACDIVAKYPEFFGANSIAEQELLFEDAIWRIDRLLVEPDKVTIIDFKSGSKRLLPKYKEQLNNYRKVVKAKWQDRTVTGGILWTDENQFEVLF